MTLLLLAAVLISLTTATANLAGVPNAAEAQPVVGATTHPIQYWIGCAPSMVTTTNLNYFKQQGFTAVCVVVPDSQTYQTQLTTIKSLNMLPIIDIEMPIWDGGQLQSTPISNFASYFQSLKTAGWQYVASEGGRPGDLEYMQQYFKGYVNFNCDQCGLWEGGNPVYTNPFTVANSWESYYPSEWSYIQTGAKQAAALGIQNGILAGTWANSGGDNQIYANSVSGSGTSYLSMLNWSYANGIGFTSFHVWCGDNSQGLSQYKSLGFDKLVAAMQVYYPATKSASLATGKQGTQLTLTASNTTPAVNQSVTFKATLTIGGTPFSEPVTIYHYLNGVRYNDITAYSTLTFATNWTTPGVRTYYASFAGDSAYQASTSSAVTINVTTPLSGNPTQLTLTASNTTPAVNQSVTFNATLSSSETALPSESVTIYHLLNGVRYNDTTANTGTTGQITVTTSFGSPGTRSYYASFAGGGPYQASTSSVLTINVDAQTNVTLTASNTAPAVNQSVTFTATLSWWNPATGKWVAVTTSGEPIQIWHTLNGVRYNDTTINTNSSGTATFTQKWTSAGTRSYYATFAGDTSYNVSTSAVVTISVH
ncbi:MAG: Ig-like domain-containing protein [Halobacteriota archaeon]